MLLSDLSATTETHEPSGYLEKDTGEANAKRFVGFGVALAIEALIIFLLLALTWGITESDKTVTSVTTFASNEIVPEETAEPEEPRQEQAEPAVTIEPQPELPAEPPPERPPEEPEPSPRSILPTQNTTPAPPQAPPVAPAKPPSPPQTYGPPNTAAPRSNDSQRVGTASNGEPLYAARWFREPSRGELSGYLSTASAPATALIACRTVPDFYVEDCELLGENPAGSQIGRAVLAAAWQFRVRPAIIGGRSQVGSWVRIKIDYTVGR